MLRKLDLMLVEMCPSAVSTLGLILSTRELPGATFSSAGQPCRYLDTFHACKVFSKLKIHPSFCKCFSFDILKIFFHLSVPLFFQLRAIFHCQEAHHSICKMGNSLYTFHIIYVNVKYSISKTLPKINRLLILPGELP